MRDARAPGRLRPRSVPAPRPPAARSAAPARPAIRAAAAACLRASASPAQRLGLRSSSVETEFSAMAGAREFPCASVAAVTGVCVVPPGYRFRGSRLAHPDVLRPDPAGEQPSGAKSILGVWSCARRVRAPPIASCRGRLQVDLPLVPPLARVVDRFVRNAATGPALMRGPMRLLNRGTRLTRGRRPAAYAMRICGGSAPDGSPMRVSCSCAVRAAAFLCGLAGLTGVSAKAEGTKKAANATIKMAVLHIGEGADIQSNSSVRRFRARVPSRIRMCLITSGDR